MSETKKIYDKRLVIPVTDDIWKNLKQIANDNDMSMNQIARIAFNKLIKNYKKNNKKEL